MGIGTTATRWYRLANDSFGRHGIVWAILLFVLPLMSFGALAGYLASTADWYWQHFGWLGVWFAVLGTWILLGCVLLVIRAWNPSWFRIRLSQDIVDRPTMGLDQRNWYSVRGGLSSLIDKTIYSQMRAALAATAENGKKQASYREQINNLSASAMFDSMRQIYSAEITKLQAQDVDLQSTYRVALESCLFDLKIKLAHGFIISKGYIRLEPQCGVGADCG